MYDINLLNGYNKPTKNIKVIAIVIAMVVVTGFLSYVCIIVPLRDKNRLTLEVSKFAGLNTEYEYIEKEHGHLSRQIEELKQKADNISPMVTVIKWSEVFSLIEREIPHDVALLNLSYREGMLTIQGRAESDIEVARFITGLKNAGLFTKVKLKRIDRDGSGESFIMLCTF